MRRGIPVQRSRAADWARFSGALALPILVLGVLGLRVGVVPQAALEPVLIVGFVLGLAALGLALYSLADIWKSGAEGARTAIAGLVYAAPVLVILGLVAAAAIAYPRLTDVSTDIDNPPLFTAPGSPHGAQDSKRAALQRAAYPEIVSHDYPLPLGEVYAAARKIIDTRRWTVTSDIHPAEMPGEADATAPTQSVPEDDALLLALSLKDVVTQSRSGTASETAPGAIALPEVMGPPIPEELQAPIDQATIEALAPTPVFGFLDDVVVRLKTTPDGTQVDVRSASRIGEHDLGQNARRIRSFLTELDSVLQPDPAAAAAQ
jgi:hypothetical protein